MRSVRELAELLGSAEVIGNPDVAVEGLSCDSRKVKPQDLFVCVNGFQSDGHRFASEAVAKGACALVVEYVPEGFEAGSAVLIKTENSRKALAVLSAEFCGRPADKLLNIGVTGTNGKTTVSYLVEAILKASGRNPGMLGTIEAHVAGEVRKLSNTTPESFDLHNMFSEMVEAGQDSVVMEVSSHSVSLDRVYGIPFDVAVFTNLTQDHLDFHKTMENYFQAKSKLFTRLGIYGERAVGPFAVLNIDDPYGVRMADLIRSRVPIVTFGTSSNADVRAYNVEASPNGLSFTLETRVGAKEVHLQLSGQFNLENALAAAAVGMALRINLDTIVEALESVSAVPGRFQLVRCGQNFTVLVDYAHTPDGLKHLLDSARPITRGRIHLVFGCGGDRDKGKRAIMGQIAAEKADKVYITNDNPRSEAPEAIVEQILAGISDELMKKKNVEVIYSRAEAIEKALRGAASGDTVVIAGKGHETYQKIGDHTEHFDDVEQARSILNKMSGSSAFGRSATSAVRMKVRWDRSAFDEARYVVGQRFF